MRKNYAPIRRRNIAGGQRWRFFGVPYITTVRRWPDVLSAGKSKGTVCSRLRLGS